MFGAFLGKQAHHRSHLEGGLQLRQQEQGTALAHTGGATAGYGRDGLFAPGCLLDVFLRHLLPLILLVALRQSYWFRPSLPMTTPVCLSGSGTGTGTTLCICNKPSHRQRAHAFAIAIRRPHGPYRDQWFDVTASAMPHRVAYKKAGSRCCSSLNCLFIWINELDIITSGIQLLPYR
jgi:hypothetical protein